MVVVEAEYDDFVQGRFRSQMTVKSALATLAAWYDDYNIMFQFLDSLENAETFARTLFYMHHRRRLKELFQAAPFLRNI